MLLYFRASGPALASALRFRSLRYHSALFDGVVTGLSVRGYETMGSYEASVEVAPFIIAGPFRAPFVLAPGVGEA